MFIRIVKLSFQPDKINLFLENFEKVKQKIRHFPGNNFLELYQDKENSSVFFTYSIWNEVQDLENYKNSDLFREIWAETKPFFNDKPQAWSVDKLSSLP